MKPDGHRPLEPKSPRDSFSEITDIVAPADTNPLGNLLGGRLMHLIDTVGSLAAARHSRRRVVTASVNHIDFLRPIRLGRAVILKAIVEYVGRTSMDIRVDVEMERLLKGERIEVARAWLTFVALDEEGKPAPVPPLLLETEEDRRRHQEAEARRARRTKAEN